MNIAQITVSGNVGQAPEIKEVNGTKVANFSVAVNESYTTKSGEKRENTHWFRCEAWDGSNGKGLVTNVIEKYVAAGTTVFVQGFPMVESYEQDGQKRTAFKIKLAGVSSTFRLINSKPVDSTTTKGDTKSPKVDEKVDDEIPF
jgi:single-strand DNA-binding protein